MVNHVDLLVLRFRFRRLAPCDSPYVLVLYITTTLTQKQAPNPKKVSAALQAMRRYIPQPESNMGPKLLLFFGISVTHGAVGGGLDAAGAPSARVSVSQLRAIAHHAAGLRPPAANCSPMLVVPIEEESELRRP